MATTIINKTEFIIPTPKGELHISAYTTSSRYYFREIAECNGKRGVYKYDNRPWQNFRYDVALQKLGAAFGKKVSAAIEEWKANKVAAEHAESERFLARFRAAHAQLNEGQKKSLENVEVHTEEQANALMAIVQFGAILNQL